MNTKKNWNQDDVLSQKGKLAVITGSTGGIGYETARALSVAGAEVILAARNAAKGEETIRKIIQEVPNARVRFEQIDLACLDSVRKFAQRLITENHPPDLLINNAAVMNPPSRLETADGFELQFGTNYLGHFALTGLLLPLLRQAGTPRVVTLSSVAARSGVIDFDDLQAERGYKPMKAYSQTKLACLMFSLELQRRSEASGWGIESMAAHPGISRTDLIHNGAGAKSAAGLARSILWFLFQPAAQGALPTLFAATSPHAKGGGYYGPAGFAEIRGAPTSAAIPKLALDPEAASRLWEMSEPLAGVTFSTADPNATTHTTTHQRQPTL